MQSLSKPTIKEQITFIQVLRNTLESVDEAPVSITDDVMLREILENLIAVRLWTKTLQFTPHQDKSPYLKWVLIEANDYFLQAMAAMDVIVKTESFTELKHKERQIYLRLPEGNVQPGEIFKMYIEPQVNMSRSQRLGNASIKIQLSCLRFRESRYSSPITSKMDTADFIHYLNVCEEWGHNIDCMIAEEPELDFKKAEQIEREPDMMGYSQAEEAERMHRIQRDLK